MTRPDGTGQIVRERTSDVVNVSVVVPTVDGGPTLLECLERFDPAGAGAELILVDNGSSDGSVEKVVERFPSAQVIRNEVNQGFAEACNQGASTASGPFILFLNDDAFIDSESLHRLLEAARGEGSAAIWQPLILRTDGTVEFSGDSFTWWGFFVHLQDRPLGPEPAAVFATKAACLLVRKDVFDALGGFQPEYFAYFEEADLCWRARMAGWDVNVVPASKVLHVGGSTTTRLFDPAEVRYLSFRNRLRTILANASVASLARILPLHLIGCLGFAILFLVTGRLRSLTSVVAAVLWPIRHRHRVRDQRRQAQAIRVLPDSHVLRRDLTSGVTPRILWRHLTQQIYRWERAAGRNRFSKEAVR